MQLRKTKFLRRILSGVLAASIMLTSAVTAFAAKSSTNASTSIPGSSTAYDGSYIRIWLNSYSGLELTPNNGEKIYTSDVLYHRMYNIADTLLRSDPPLGSLKKYENGQWVAAKDNIDYPSDPDFIVNSSRTNMYYVKPGKYREERAYYLDKGYECSITYDVLPGPRPSDVNPGKSDFKLSGHSSPIRVGETTVVSAMLDISGFSYYKDVTWTLESDDDSPAHGEITVDPSYPAHCLYSAKTPGTDWIIATDPLGKRKSVSVMVLPPEHASAGLLRDVSVGSSVKLNVDGVPQEFIVVHQGKPSNLYDDSCNGTWLLMKYLDSESRPIVKIDGKPTANDNDYANSDIHKYLNNDFLDRLDNNIRAQIKEVKIPYRPGSGTATTVNSGGDGLSAKAFLLSGAEVHSEIIRNDYYGRFPNNEGSALKFFAESGGNGVCNTVRYAYRMNDPKTPYEWWLRSPDCVDSSKTGGKRSIYINSNGRCFYGYSCGQGGIRPALILPSSLSVSDDAFVIAPLSVDDLSVSPSALNMDVGDEEMITVKRLPEGATEDPISFSSENKEIATVGFVGTVTATGEGQTNIVITCGGVTKTIPVTVNSVIPSLERLVFDTGSLDMKVGDVEDCPAKKVPAEAEGDISYSSNDPDVATVNEDGKITAVGEGETTITASCGDVTAQIPVTVHPAPAPDLTDLLLNPTGATIPVGESEQFTAVKVPDNAEGDVSFSVLNPEIASVDENGLVEAIKPGETKLVASCGDVTKEAVITVPAPSEPEKSKTTDLTVQPDDVSMQVGDKQPLDVTKEPADSEDPIIYESKDPGIAAVDPDGTITGISPGETTVVVTSGEITKEIPVKVQPAPVPDLSDLSLDPDEATIPVGETKRFTAAKIPAEADGDISFRVLNPRIASVDEYGLVTALEPGETKLIASCGGISKEAAITVPSVSIKPEDPEKPGTSDLTVQPEAVTVGVGGKQPLGVEKEPADSKDPITYESKDPGIATVDPDGTITGISPGETTVVVTSGSVTKEIPVKVQPAPAPNLTDLSLDPNEATIPVGKTKPFTATKIPAEADGDISFRVLDPEIASVNEHGLVTALGPGETKLVASCGGISKEAAITVPSASIEPEDPEKPGTSDLTVQPEAVTVGVGGKQPLGVEKEPADSKDPITYESKDPGIAAVDPDGTITGISSGETTVVVISGSVTKEIPVKVEAKDPDDGKNDGKDDDKDDGKDDGDNSGNNNNPDDGSNTNPGNARVGSLVLRNTGVNSGKNKAFNYRFTFPENAGGEYRMSGDVSGTVKDGSVITLYPGDEVRISGLPVGGSYRVEELDPGNRYSVRHKVDGIGSFRGFVAGFSIAKDECTTVEFINTKAGSSNGSSSSSHHDRYDRDDSDRGSSRDDPDYDDGRHPTRRPNENPEDRALVQIEINPRVPLKGNPYMGR